MYVDKLRRRREDGDVVFSCRVLLGKESARVA